MRSKKQKKNLYFFGASNIFRNQPKFIIVSTSKWISAHGLPWMAITFNILGLHCDRVHSIGPLINIYGMMCMRGIGCIKIDKYCAYTICILNWIDTWYMLWNFFFRESNCQLQSQNHFNHAFERKKTNRKIVFEKIFIFLCLVGLWRMTAIPLVPFSFFFLLLSHFDVDCGLF